MNKFERLEYKSEIDGLRAIAVIIVLFYHSDLFNFTGGFIGVDVFFVLSGFLITHQIFDKLYFTDNFNFLEFYAKRFRRLFPLIYLVIVLVIFIWGLFLTGLNDETSGLIKSIRYGIFGLANVFFERNTGGYFDVQSDFLPLLHFWSLAVEEQFYLVWPLLLYTTSKLLGSKNIKYLLLTIIFCSFSYTLYLINDGNKGAFYWMPARAWELATGGILVFILPVLKELKISKSTLTSLSLAGLTIIVSCAYFYDNTTIFPGVNAILPVIATIILISSIFLGENTVSLLLKNKQMVLIGTLSYGIYLWHWPLFSLYKNYIGSSNLPTNVKLSIILLTFLLSYFSFKFIENLIRFSKYLKQHPIKNILFFILISLILVFSSRVLKLLDRNKVLSTPELKILEERNPLRSICHNKISMIGSPDCIIKKTDRDQSIFYVWGNSHSDSFFPAVVEYAKHKRNISVVQLSASNYPAILNFKGTEGWNFNREGQVFHKKAFDLIKETQVPFSVFYVSRWFHFFKSKTEQELIKPKIKETIQNLQKMEIQKIYIVLPSIEFEKSPTRCIARKIDCSVSKEGFKKKRFEIVEFFIELQKEFKSVHLIDILPYTCPGDRCENVIDGTPVNYDHNHMTSAMAKKIPLSQLIE